jgi:hypothetical protein
MENNSYAYFSKGKVIPVTGRGGSYSCEMLRLPHFLDNRLTYGSEVVSLMRWPVAHYPQENCWYSYLFEAEWTQGPLCGGEDWVWHVLLLCDNKKLLFFSVQLEISLCRGVGEKERTLYFHITHISENMKKNSLKWLKWQELHENWKSDLKLKNAHKVCISVTSNSSPGFIYLRKSHRIQGKKDVMSSRCRPW